MSDADEKLRDKAEALIDAYLHTVDMLPVEQRLDQRQQSISRPVLEIITFLRSLLDRLADVEAEHEALRQRFLAEQTRADLREVQRDQALQALQQTESGYQLMKRLHESEQQRADAALQALQRLRDVLATRDYILAQCSLRIDRQLNDIAGSVPWCSYCGGQHLIEACPDYNLDEGEPGTEDSAALAGPVGVPAEPEIVGKPCTIARTVGGNVKERNDERCWHDGGLWHDLTAAPSGVPAEQPEPKAEQPKSEWPEWAYKKLGLDR